jgi:hypothetical protein
MKTLRIIIVLAGIGLSMLASDEAQNMTEGGGGGGAHYCVRRDTDTPPGSPRTYVALKNTCSKAVIVFACGRLERSSGPNGSLGKVSCDSHTIATGESFESPTLGWICDGAGCDNWTFVWNAEYADSGITPTSPMKNRATSGR